MADADKRIYVASKMPDIQPGETAFDRENKLPLHDVISRETKKIMKMKIENDLKVKHLNETIEELEKTNQSQKNNIVQIQMEQEKLSDKLCHEQRLREITLNKVATTRNVCAVLENSFKELTDTFKHCKNNRDMIQQAFDNATNVLMEIKKKHEKVELELKQKVQEMEIQVTSEKNKKTEHENVINELKKEMMRNCEHLKKQIFLLDDSNKKLQQQKNDTIVALSESRENAQKMEHSLEAEKERSFSLSKEFSALSDEFSQMKIEMDNLVDNYQKQIENLNMQIEQLKHDYQIREDLIEKQKNDYEVLKADYQQKMQTVVAEIQELNNENLEYNRKIQELILEKESFVEKIVNFEKENIEKNNVIEQLKINNSDLNNVIDEMKNLNLEYEKKITDFEILDKENQELKNIVKNLQNDKSALESNLQDSIENLDKKINDLQSEKNNILDELKNAKEKVEECENFKTLSKTQQSQSKKMENELQKLKDESKNKTDQLESVKSKLNEEISKKTGVLNNLLDELKTRQDEIEHIKTANLKKNNIQNSHIDSLKEIIIERDNTLKMMREENNDLKIKLKNLETVKKNEEITREQNIELKKKVKNLEMAKKNEETTKKNAETDLDVYNLDFIDPAPVKDQETVRKSQTSFALPKIRKISYNKTPQTTTKLNPILNSPGADFLSDCSSDGYVFDAERVKFRFNQYLQGNIPKETSSSSGVPVKRTYKRKNPAQDIPVAQSKKK